MTTRDDWSGCDNEAQEEVMYWIGNYMDTCREVMAKAKTRGLTTIEAGMQLNINTARAALMVLEDLAGGSLATMPPQAWDVLAAMVAQRDEAIEERDEARRVNAERHEEIRAMKSALDKATREAVQMVFRERAAIEERDVAIENAKTLVEAAERPGSWGAGKGPTSEAKAEFVDAMAKPAEVKPSCHGCEHARGIFDSQGHRVWSCKLSGWERRIAMAPGATCPTWCPRLEANQ